ncbi:tetratricopeptide (TPR) repeat protein [Chitinivorax tropicus]|uniref:Tetratricopeptide (TPR) repeat protein n=1 Tax=Chitinivorax tropicus TaxID=714531 RepID=A0A840MQK3_9PROT|nr:SEC-C metal-binding domain-containing protein [Chitinivorax tropicus]MBB5019367.1 tetratricopeptide (TPR) repeat protein [Chitinivorax tropicus]
MNMEPKRDALDELLSETVANAIKQPDPAGLSEWMVAVWAPKASEVFNRPITAEHAPRLMRLLAKAICNVLPRPENDYRPVKWPKTERNAACDCGSGLKYKHCCAALEAGLPVLSVQDLLPYVLAAVPKAHLQRLPLGRMDLEALADVAIGWAERNQHERAVLLLEPIFKQSALLDERAELAFDVLMDSYLALNKPKKRTQLLEAVLSCQSQFLQAVAWRRLAAIHADAGEHDLAMEAFSKAQHLAPDHPALGPLEVTLWLAGHDVARAVERAAFWRAHYKKISPHLYAQPLSFMEEVITDPAAIQREMGMASEEEYRWFAPLGQLLDTLPVAQARYTLQPAEDGGMVLQALPELATLESTWEEVLRSIQGDTSEQEEALWDVLAQRDKWLTWLKANPTAFDNVTILDQLYFLASMLDEEKDESVLPVLEQLSVRIEAITDLLLSSEQQGTVQLPWRKPENRPLLRMLGVMALTQSGDVQLQHLERLVLGLNPTDEQQLRYHLGYQYLTTNQLDKMIALGEAFSEDNAEMCFNHALALFLVGNEEQATTVLERGIQTNPQLAAMLIQSRAKRAQPGDSQAEEGAAYRQQYHALWKNSGGLSWLKKQKACS